MSSGWPADVRSSSRTAAIPGSPRICRARSSPSISGIMPSISATGNGSLRTAAFKASRAAGPLSTATGLAPQLVRTSSRMRRLVALSSTIKTGSPSRRGTPVRRVREPSWGRVLSQIVNQKVLPMPGSLSTQIRPPISSTSLAEIVRPSPVPPNRRVVEPSACSNGWKIVCNFSTGMPIPVSATAKRSTTSSVPT